MWSKLSALRCMVALNIFMLTRKFATEWQNEALIFNKFQSYGGVVMLGLRLWVSRGSNQRGANGGNAIRAPQSRLSLTPRGAGLEGFGPQMVRILPNDAGEGVE